MSNRDVDAIRSAMTTIARSKIDKAIEENSLRDFLLRMVLAGQGPNLADNLLFEIVIDLIYKEYPWHKDLLQELY